MDRQYWLRILSPLTDLTLYLVRGGCQSSTLKAGTLIDCIPLNFILIIQHLPIHLQLLQLQSQNPLPSFFSVVDWQDWFSTQERKNKC